MDGFYHTASRIIIQIIALKMFQKAQKAQTGSEGPVQTPISGSEVRKSTINLCQSQQSHLLTLNLNQIQINYFLKTTFRGSFLL